MEENNYWRDFWSSGKIEDYLKCKAAQKENVISETEGITEKMLHGGAEDAGSHRSNGNCY